jgi:hypothetical protein
VFSASVSITEINQIQSSGYLGAMTVVKNCTLIKKAGSPPIQTTAEMHIAN